MTALTTTPLLERAALDAVAGEGALMTARELAAIVGCNVNTVGDLIKAGHLPGTWTGSRYLIPRYAVAAWLLGVQPEPAIKPEREVAFLTRVNFERAS